jgi:hypothetical protein
MLTQAWLGDKCFHSTSTELPLSFFPIFFSLFLSASYGISVYGVSRPGIQNKKGFCIKINLPKGNY